MKKHTEMYRKIDKRGDQKSSIYHNRSWKLKKNMLFICHSDELRTQCLKETFRIHLYSF